MNDLECRFFSAETLPPHAFYNLRKQLYGDAILRDEINYRYLLTCLLIYQHGEVVARLCLYRNEKINDGKTLLFGNLESIQDTAVFNRLMQEVLNYAEQHEYKEIIGPMNGSTWDEYRLPVTRFGSRFITDLLQPEYYAVFLQQNGYQVSQRYFTHLSPVTPKTTDTALVQQLLQQKITVRNIDLAQYENELEKLYNFCSVMFAGNVLFSPTDKAAFTQKYLQVKTLLQPEFVLLAEDEAQQLQGFILSIPDPYQPQGLVVKTIARNTHNRACAGLMTYLIDLLYNRVLEKGFTQIFHAFMHNNNRSKVLSQQYDGEVFKEYVLFSKNRLTDAG